MTVDMIIAQIGIIIFGMSSIWFVGRKEEWRKWGYLLGLCSQPFWFYITIKSELYGVALLSCWYTYSWCQGIYYHIIKGGINIKT